LSWTILGRGEFPETCHLDDTSLELADLSDADLTKAYLARANAVFFAVICPSTL
jgi:uncharacterized protein YjbI with pentapeptide repeats